MNYNSKMMVGIGTAPSIICGILIGSFNQNVPLIISVFVVFLVSSICYQAFVIKTDKSNQPLRFWVLFIFPIVLFILVMRL
jgi:hypothetical protein